MRSALALMCIAGIAVACESTSVPAPAPSAVASAAALPKVLVVYTTWVPDARVTNGPEPGYKPAMAGLTSRDIRSASAVLDANGVAWVVNIVFADRGAALFRTLTRNNVSACPTANQNCPQRHLAIWLGLTQTDIDGWDNPATVSEVSRPFDLSCIGATTCPKLISDPITVDEITGGQMVLAGAFTQTTARGLAAIINSPPAA